MADAPDYDRIKRNISKMISLGAPEADIDAYVASENVTPEQLRGATKQPSTAADMAGAAVSGLARGTAETAMAPVTLKRAGEGLVQTGMDYVRDTVGGWFGAEPLSDEYKARRAANLAAADPLGGILYGAQDDARAAMDQTLYKPKTDAGKYTESVTSFVPGALLGGAGAASKIGQVAKFAVAPGIASEAAGQATEGSKWEPWARAAGAMGGALAANAVRMPASMEKYFTPAQSDALANVPTKAQRFALKGADPAVIQKMKTQIDEIGPEGTLADVSTKWRAIARASNARPDMGDEISDVFLTRDAGRDQRMRSAIGAEIGPAKSPLTLEGEIKAAKQAISPEYDQVLSRASAVDTKPLADALEAIAVNERGAGAAAARQVRDMLNVAGENVLDPNPATLLATRKAVDGMLRSEADPNTVRILSAARRAIDDELAAKVPGIKAIDAKWADVERQAKAYDTGRDIFRSGDNPMWPDELAAKQKELVQPAGSVTGVAGRSGLDRLAEGARAKLEEIVGTNAKDVLALNRLLKGEGDWNRDKLRMTFGQDKADKILRVMDSEMRMAATKARVVDGSDTAQTREFTKFLDDTAEGNRIPTDISIIGGPLRLTQKVANAVIGNRSEAKAAKFAADLGRLSVARGAERDAVIQALLQRAQTMKPGQLTTGAEAVVRSILAGGASQ
jgi:hypothetical protein